MAELRFSHTASCETCFSGGKVSSQLSLCQAKKADVIESRTRAGEAVAVACIPGFMHAHVPSSANAVSPSRWGFRHLAHPARPRHFLPPLHSGARPGDEAPRGLLLLWAGRPHLQGAPPLHDAQPGCWWAALSALSALSLFLKSPSSKLGFIEPDKREVDRDCYN